MKKITLGLLAGSLLTTFVKADDWRQFRGANASAFAAKATPPTNLSGESAVAWKAALPGRGLSSPILVGERVFVTACSGVGQDRLHILCFDDKTGKKVWERQFWATGRTMSHDKTSVAAPTPASDGTRIFALYSSNDLICVDLDGNLQWARGLGIDYPNASNSLGMASSPIVVGGTLIVPSENDSESLTAGLDPETGENRWKHDRPKKANWCSPVAVTRVGKPAAVLQSAEDLVVVEPETGEVLFKQSAGFSTIPSAAVEGSLLFAPGGNGIVAFDLASNQGQELWRSNKLFSATASPVAADGKIYAINSAGVLNSADQKTGKVVWQLRLKGPFSGSPVIANGRLYVANEKGVVQVVKLGADAGTVESERNLDDTILCTPAVGPASLYLRSDQSLWKLGS